MKKLFLICLVCISGCSTTVPVKIPFPDVPPLLMEPSVNLKTLDGSKELQLSDILENVNENAGKYYVLKAKLAAWQEWYAAHKKIYEELNK